MGRDRLPAAVLLAMAVAVMLTVRLTAAGQSSELVVGGATVDEWRRRMSALPLDDRASAAYVPGLIAVVQEARVPWFTRRQAALTLGRLGPIAPSGVPVLTDLSSEVGADPATGPQLWAIKGLSLYGPVAQEAVPSLISTFTREGTSPLARLSIVECLSQVGVASEASVPFLARLVQRDPRVMGTSPPEEMDALQRAAVEALGVIGSPAASAVPLLVRVLESPDENLRREAVASLGKMGAAAQVAALALAERLVLDDVPAVQDAAATSLAALGPGASRVVLPQLESEDPTVRERVLTICASWGDAARPWRTAIRACWDDGDPRVRLAALETSWKIERDGPAVAARVIDEFTNEDRQVQRRAYRLFVALGTGGCGEAGQLRELLQHQDAGVRIVARKALEACGDAE